MRERDMDTSVRTLPSTEKVRVRGAVFGGGKPLSPSPEAEGPEPGTREGRGRLGMVRVYPDPFLEGSLAIRKKLSSGVNSELASRY